ncbi:MAG: FUSC family protein [Gammaproteobacteria bacterium]|nr:FUSC family protein [Gammaproteobacteria bacterium]NND60634.1 FUSC family protein [Gammaproteobacteria bacterium]
MLIDRIRLPSFDIDQREARDAVRLALQSAAAAAIMYVVMQALGLPEKFVGVLSAVLVVQPSIGNTLSQGWDRVAATVVGILIGIASMLILPSGYGTAVALAFSMLVMNAVAGFRPSWRYGVVAAVALAMGSDGELLQTAFDRTLSIGIGVVVGIAVSLLVWPDKAETRALRYLRQALRGVAGCLKAALNEGKVDSDSLPDNPHQTYLSNISDARKEAHNVRLADNDSLLEKLDSIERFYYAVMILNRVAEETNDFDSASDDLAQPMYTIRDNACAVAVTLARGECDYDNQLSNIRNALKQLRQYTTDAGGDTDDLVNRNALVFGLDEIEDSLDELTDLFQDND